MKFGYVVGAVLGAALILGGKFLLTDETSIRPPHVEGSAETSSQSGQQSRSATVRDGATSFSSTSRSPSVADGSSRASPADQQSPADPTPRLDRSSLPSLPGLDPKSPGNERLALRRSGGDRARQAQAWQAAVATETQIYAPFFDGSKLSPEKRDAVVSVLAEELQSKTDIFVLSAQQQLSGARRRDLLAEASKAAESELKAILTEEEMARMAEYRRTLPYRPLAQRTAERCAANGIPMTPAAVDALASLLTSAPIPVYSGGRVVSPDLYKTITSGDPRAVAAASKVLSPAQLAVLKEVLAGRVSVQ